MRKKPRKSRRTTSRKPLAVANFKQRDHTASSEPRSEAEVFSDLSDLCRSPGYVHALSYLIFRDSTVTAGDEFTKEDFKKLYDRERLIRTELVTLIGLWLKGDRSLVLPDALTVQDYVERTEKLLSELHAAMLAPAHRDFSDALEAHSSGGKGENPLGKAAAMREAIFYSGESGFTFQYIDFAEQRYAEDAAWLEEHYGFDISAAATLFKALIAHLSEQMPIRMRNMRQLPMSEWTILPIYCFTEDEAIQASGLRQETVRAIIKAFSVRTESRNERYSDIFSFNDAAVTPFVPLEDGRYAFLQEYVGAEALYNSPSYWMREDDDYKATASINRGHFAESMSLKLIERAFPPHRIFRNVVFKASKKVTAAEADLVLVHGKRAFVFQLKSKGLTEQARGGNELAITRDFSAAVQTAYDQAVSCIRCLRDGTPMLVNGNPFEIPNLSGIEEYYPVCITSENYPALSFQVGQFLQRSQEPWVQSPIIMDIFTLDVITEFLRSPLYLVDYLTKRSSLFDKALSSHELVVLAFHLRQNLYVPGDINMVYVQDDFMIELDLAMAVRRRGLPGPATPSGLLTRDLDNPLGRILVGADQTDRPEVHELGELILNLSSDAWENINGWVRGLCRQSRRDHKNHDLTVPLEEGRTGLTIHCNDLQQAEAFDELAAHCEIRKYLHKADRWFGVCLDPATEEVRFAMGRIARWQFDEQLDVKARSLKVRSANHFVDASGQRTKLRRNDPCPCGSSRKYKKCCLN